jgi:hypothetical protein
LATFHCPSNPVSEAEAAVLRIAQRETLPQYAAEFEPITRGFLFAVVSLGALGVLAVVHILWRALARAFSHSRGDGR